MPLEDGLRYVELGDEEDLNAESEDPAQSLVGGGDELETLRDEFVDAFNARDLDAVLSIVRDDVECPDAEGDGAPGLASQLADIWERSPGAILTRAFLDASPCAMAWLPDETGCWSAASLVMLDGEEDLLTLVTLVDDADALERAAADDPTGEELEEGSDWSEWDSGEASQPVARDRQRP